MMNANATPRRRRLSGLAVPLVTATAVLLAPSAAAAAPQPSPRRQDRRDPRR